MFIKSTIALVILLGVTSGAFAAAEKHANPASPGGVYINKPAKGWQNPDLGTKRQPNPPWGWDCSYVNC
jgi:hypothetical protein